MQPYLWRAMDKLVGIYKLFSSLIVTMDVNKENLLKRAQNSFANVTELADSLVRSEAISFRQSHKIVSLCVQELLAQNEESLSGLTWQLANEKCLEVTGKPLQINEIAFYQALQPEYFVNIRTLKGGPAPQTMRDSLTKAEDESAVLENWLREKSEAILKAEEQLEKILKEWSSHD